METTIDLPEPLLAAARAEAAERRVSLSALVAEVLRRSLDSGEACPHEGNGHAGPPAGDGAMNTDEFGGFTSHKEFLDRLDEEGKKTGKWHAF